MGSVRRAMHALAEAALAGALAGAIEATRVIAVGSAGSLGAWLVLAALAGLGAIAVAVVVRGGLALVMRAGALARWTADLTGGGERRVIAAWRAGVIAVAVLAFAAGSFVVSAWAHEAFRFIDPAPVGLLHAGLLTPLAALIAAAAVALDRRLAPWLVARPGGLDGRRWRVVLTLAGLGAVIGPIALVHLAVPAVSLAPITIGALLVVAVVVARALRIGRRPVARLAALLVVLAAIAGTGAIGRAERARGLVVEQGVIGKVVARTIWAFADRDGDRFPPAWVGGADCDDDNPWRHPAILETAGNGIDENCTGADAGPRPGRPPAAPASGEPRPNIVVISVDALRADHLGAWGYARPTSPVLDAFAATATRFSWALTSSPTTRHAVPSLFTGRYGSRDPFETPVSMIEVLRDAGWETAAILCCERLVGRNELRGFATVDTTADAVRQGRAGKANADTVADEAIEWLARARRDRPFALWLHFYDPHHPYTRPEGGPDFGGSDLDRYDAEIVFADHHIGRVLTALDQAGLAATTIVAVTADHGDEFNEHGLRFHARSLYNQVTRIPLIVRAPRARPSVIEVPVSLVDLAPTLLELAGVPHLADPNGISLAPAILGTAPVVARPILIELFPDRQIDRDLVAAVHDGWKVIWDREANAWSLYAREDAGDRHDRAEAEPAVLATMKQTLFELVDRELAAAP